MQTLSDLIPTLCIIGAVLMCGLGACAYALYQAAKVDDDSAAERDGRGEQ